MNLKTTQFPFKVKKFPFFYGWIILIAGTIGVLASIPGQTIGVSVFTDYLIDAIGIKRTDFSLTYLIGTVTSGFLITKAGKYYDLYGARIMAMVAGVLLGVFLLLLTKIDLIIFNISAMLGDNSKMIVAYVMLGISFFGIRFFGQGILTMVSRNMVMKWFERYRGLANGIMGVFISFGFAAAPKIFNSMIEYSDWRSTWMYIAIFLILVFTTIVLFLFRDNAQDCGLPMDGNPSLKPKRKKKVLRKAARDYTLKEARSTYVFWIFNLTIALNALFITAISFHVVSIFEEVNLTRDVAVSIFIPSSIIAMSVNFFGGYLSDHIKLKYLVMFNLLGIIVASIGVIFLGGASWGLMAIIIGNGITQGVMSIINTVVWPRFFGTKHLGAISGYSMSWTVVGSALGPYLFSLSLRYGGAYDIALVASIVVAIVLFFFSFKANNINQV